MAVDITLVLPSEHRRMEQLVQRCGRPTRGFHDPAAELAAVATLHLAVAAEHVYPEAQRHSQRWPQPTVDALFEALTAGNSDEVIPAVRALLEFETTVVLPALESALNVPARRRIGKVFRVRRDAAARATTISRRRQPSQTELYEMARRAGVSQRSRMTQSELRAAIRAHGVNL